MNFDYQTYRYPSRKECVFARKGMVCTSQPLAAQAGLDVLKTGVNAVDAAVAPAAAMAVPERTSDGDAPAGLDAGDGAGSARRLGRADREIWKKNPAGEFRAGHPLRQRGLRGDTDHREAVGFRV